MDATYASTLIPSDAGAILGAQLKFGVPRPVGTAMIVFASGLGRRKLGYWWSSFNGREERCGWRRSGIVLEPIFRLQKINVLNPGSWWSKLFLFWFRIGISRDNLHKRRATGGKRKIIRKKRKYDLGRPAANTKVSFRIVLGFCVALTGFVWWNYFACQLTLALARVWWP